MRTLEFIHGSPFPSFAGCVVNCLNAAHTAQEHDTASNSMLYSLTLILAMRWGDE